ncbi:MAG: sigma 54-interacting transcriptional regulator [Spirochaetaceae bacterium]|jgi:Nif-specific regulatory protein|nr:sigma 54-interacting transcriptional regulator [Spirochaetaceae bacterium]
MSEQDRRNKERVFIAESAAMKEKLAVLEKIAKTGSPVLVLGESGTGKELFAEEVHIRSDRAKGPFVSVNCAALPLGLAESELFGHVKGAFSGAENDRKGRLELAETGTLFLDEIADVELPIQAKLLRFLAEKSFEKVGGDVSLTADVRIVAATNRNLESLIEDGLFRKDLYYRLNVLPIRVPPLRERGEDIKRLAVFFRENYERAAGKNFEGFSADALAALMSYAWPGNVRELSNCIERACVVADGPLIEKDDLFLMSEPSAAGFVNADCDLKTAVDDFKRHFIRATLEKNNWNQTQTAAVLDIARTYLSRLIKELDVMKDA